MCIYILFTMYMYILFTMYICIYYTIPMNFQLLGPGIFQLQDSRPCARPCRTPCTRCLRRCRNKARHMAGAVVGGWFYRDKMYRMGPPQWCLLVYNPIHDWMLLLPVGAPQFVLWTSNQPTNHILPDGIPIFLHFLGGFSVRCNQDTSGAFSWRSQHPALPAGQTPGTPEFGRPWSRVQNPRGFPTSHGGTPKSP